MSKVRKGGGRGGRRREGGWQEEIHRKENGSGPCEVLAIILFHPVICLHVTLKAKYILFFFSAL